MYFSSYGLLNFILKSAQNAKFAVNYTLRWNNSNLITKWETVKIKKKTEEIENFRP